jgi:hypothetical protein
MNSQVTRPPDHQIEDDNRLGRNPEGMSSAEYAEDSLQWESLGTNKDNGKGKGKAAAKTSPGAVGSSTQSSAAFPTRIMEHGNEELSSSGPMVPGSKTNLMQYLVRHWGNPHPPLLLEVLWNDHCRFLFDIQNWRPFLLRG